MSLQKQVELYTSAGAPGAKATPDQSIYTPINFLASVDMPVGAFAFASDTEGMATNVAGTQTSVLGFVERTISYADYKFDEAGTLIVPEGSALTIAVKGDYWAVSAESAATAGQKVLASVTDGSISTGTAATEGTNIDTGWMVKTSAEAGEPFIISNWA